MNNETNPLREELTLWLINRIEGYKKYRSDNPDEASVYNALISELETILITQVQSALQSQSLPAEQPEKEQLINACKYGYEYHANTKFPELSFEENCKNNFLQKLQPSQPEGKTLEDCRAFLIKELGMSPLQADTLYNGYVEACFKYANQPRKEWISVEKRLPAISDFRPPVAGKPLPKEFPVIVATNEGKVFETVYTGLGFANVRSYTDYVTHWQPLPTHPKK